MRCVRVDRSHLYPLFDQVLNLEPRVILEAFKVGTEPGLDDSNTLIGGGTEVAAPAARGTAGNVRPVSAGDLY